MNAETPEVHAVLAGLKPVDEDTLLLRLDEWSKNIVALNRKVCGKKDEGFDERGHAKWPCQQCVRSTQLIIKYWHEALLIKARAVRKASEVRGVELPMVDLATAFLIASSVLDPATSVELEGWGPA